MKSGALKISKSRLVDELPKRGGAGAAGLVAGSTKIVHKNSFCGF